MPIATVLFRVRFAAAWPALVLALWAAEPSAGSPQGLDELRGEALALVNRSREEDGLPALRLDPALNEAAQHHAEEMLREGYFSHVSPTGETARDRYLRFGGGASRFVAENIAECASCRPDAAQLGDLHRGWMSSPGHRANMLARGLESFGFGLASEGGRVFAVQAFAGPGTPAGAAQAEEPALDPDSQLALATRLINSARNAAGARPLTANSSFSRLLADKAGEVDLQATGLPSVDALVQALPAEQRRSFASFALLAGQCGGCGSRASEADIRFFVGAWLGDPRYRDMLLEPGRTEFGLAVSADGAGRKVALGLLAGS